MCVGGSVTLSDVTPGGTWSSSTPSIASVTTGGVVTGASAGVTNINYSVGSCSVHKTVTVNSVPATIVGSSTVHTSGSPITLTDATTGGSWFSGNPALATVGALTGVVTGVSAGTVNIYYSIGGCAVYKTITVLSPAPPGYNTGVGSVSGLGEVKLFPNPTSGNLNLEWTGQSFGVVTVTITDVVGHEVLRQETDMSAESGVNQVNVGELKDGIYLISLRSEQINFSGRLMVGH